MTIMNKEITLEHFKELWDSLAVSNELAGLDLQNNPIVQEGSCELLQKALAAYADGDEQPINDIINKKNYVEKINKEKR